MEMKNDLAIENFNQENVCNLEYLSEMMGGKKPLIKEIIDTFLKQIPEELASLKLGMDNMDYTIIKKITHTMKSSVSIMGISILAPLLQEMENLSGAGMGIEKLKQLNDQLEIICATAMKEIKKEQLNY